MNWENTTPEWVPHHGCSLRKTGASFDAVRVAGALGERVATTLAAEYDGEPGPVIGELIGDRWLYFVLPARTAGDHAWPMTAQRYTRSLTGSAAFIGVPALAGDTWPLYWYARPTPERPFVDPARLHRIVREAFHEGASDQARR
jgi:hypothetical protein